MEPWPNVGKGQLRFSSHGRVGRAGVESLCGSSSGVGGPGERNSSYLGCILGVSCGYLGPQKTHKKPQKIKRPPSNPKSNSTTTCLVFISELHLGIPFSSLDVMQPKPRISYENSEKQAASTKLLPRTRKMRKTLNHEHLPQVRRPYSACWSKAIHFFTVR